MNPALRKRFDQAVKFERDGQLSLAKEILEDLARLDPESAAIFCVLGDIYWKSGILDKAVAAFRKATELRPKLEAASLGLFIVLMKSDRAEQGYQEAKRFLSISKSQIYLDTVDEMYGNVKLGYDTKF